LASVNCGNSFSDQSPDRFDHLVGIIVDQNIDETLVITLLAAVDRPDEGAIAGIEFFDSGFFFDYFWAV
jgi:hypothetical protein